MTFLIDMQRRLVLGSFSRRGDGWSYMPHTSAHRSSRKAHPTKEDACKRYMTPACKIVEAPKASEALQQAVIAHG